MNTKEEISSFDLPIKTLERRLSELVTYRKWLIKESKAEFPYKRETFSKKERVKRNKEFAADAVKEMSSINNYKLAIKTLEAARKLIKQ